MPRKLKFLRFFSLLFFTVQLLPALEAQNPAFINSVLEGTVTDETTGAPLEGANIIIEGITNQTTTDKKGRFVLKTRQKFPFNVIVSYVGYQKKIVVANGSPIAVELLPVDGKLDDIVVVGYGKQQRRDLVGSVSSINPEKTKTIPEASFDTQIQGLVPGVQINASTGIPGSNTFIRVRGSTSINSSNDPLYIIDGVFIKRAAKPKSL
ncbi:hypothetical protein GCM10027051_25300 [Niabella terrae]